MPISKKRNIQQRNRKEIWNFNRYRKWRHINCHRILKESGQCRLLALAWLYSTLFHIKWGDWKCQRRRCRRPASLSSDVHRIPIHPTPKSITPDSISYSKAPEWAVAIHSIWVWRCGWTVDVRNVSMLLFYRHATLCGKLQHEKSKEGRKLYDWQNDNSVEGQKRAVNRSSTFNEEGKSRQTKPPNTIGTWWVLRFTASLNFSHYRPLFLLLLLLRVPDWRLTIIPFHSNHTLFLLQLLFHYLANQTIATKSNCLTLNEYAHLFRCEGYFPLFCFSCSHAESTIH